jgi:ParB-like chromosome segregation protein Spo0J
MADYSTLAAGEIRHDQTFNFRRGDKARDHVRTLQAIIRRGTKITPLLVWHEIDADGPTGRFVLLDGRHRLAAYVSLKRTSAVPVTVFEGSRAAAMEAALQANTEARLPLSPSERKNATWALVWLHGDELSIARTARAAGVSDRFVSTLRARARIMRDAGKDWTGNWFADQHDHDHMGDSPDVLTNAQRKQETMKLAKALQEAAGMWPKQDRDLFADALHDAFGRYHREAAEFLYGDEGDDFYAHTVTTDTGEDDVEDMPF